MKKIIFLITLSMLIFTSCEDNSQNALNNTNLFSSLTSATNIPSVNDFLDIYDQSELTGIVILQTKKYNVSNGSLTYNGTETNGNAIFLNNSRTNKATAGQSVIINANPIVEYSKGIYKNSTENELTYNYGADNKIVIAGSGEYPSDTTTFTMTTPIEISNVTFNQNISKSQNLTINWTGGTSGQLAQVNIIINDPINLPVNTTAGIYKKIDNHNRSITLSAQELTSSLVNGLNHIELITYQPTYKTLSNGKKVCYMTMLIHEIDVNVIN